MKAYFVTIHFTSKNLNWLSRNYSIKARNAETAFNLAEKKVKKLPHFKNISGGDCAMCYS